MKPGQFFEYKQTEGGGFDIDLPASSEQEPNGPLITQVLDRSQAESEMSTVIVARKCNGSVHWNLTVTLDKTTGERSQDIGEFSPCDCPKVTY